MSKTETLESNKTNHKCREYVRKISILMSKTDTAGKKIANKCREYARKVCFIMSKTDTPGKKIANKCCDYVRKVSTVLLCRKQIH
jgi:hypothetical protein